VLSPGALPRKIPIPGKDLEGVVTIRTPHDIKKVTAAIGPDADIIVIGTSFIGLEAAGALAKKGLRSLTVVGVDAVPFEAILSKEIGEAIVKNFESQGVKFFRGASVEKIEAGADGKVSALHVKGEKPLPASLVIMGTGVAPATEFLKDSSAFKLEKDGGITVDAYLRVPGLKNVYAIGDIAHYPQFPDGHVRRVEHWNVAGNHGRHVARTIAGSPEAYAQVPVFWSSIGKGLRYVGSGAGADDAYLDGSAEDLKFVLYQAKNGKITTVASMGRDPVVSKASELFRLGKMPSLEEIRAGKVRTPVILQC
jgi:NADPH-dependent 2,4-dienoyl-CoA reductase/sulfur reductase-like enzyme